MAQGMTQEDIKRFCKKARILQKKIQHSPEEAKRILVGSGIYDDEGNLLPPFNGEIE